MDSIVYTATVRSRTTFGTDTIRIEVFGDSDPKAVATRTAAEMGAELVSLVVENPVVALRKQLRECLGFVEAWQMHLSDTGKDKAAATAKAVHTRSQNAYSYTAPKEG